MEPEKFKEETKEGIDSMMKSQVNKLLKIL